MKKLVNLKGAKALNRQQQKEIFGGDPPIPCGGNCGGGGGSGGGANCWVMCNDGRQLNVMDCGQWADSACAWTGWSICTC